VTLSLPTDGQLLAERRKGRIGAHTDALPAPEPPSEASSFGAQSRTTASGSFRARGWFDRVSGDPTAIEAASQPVSPRRDIELVHPPFDLLAWLATTPKGKERIFPKSYVHVTAKGKRKLELFGRLISMMEERQLRASSSTAETPGAAAHSDDVQLVVVE
jgi:hypothetical protein